MSTSIIFFDFTATIYFTAVCVLLFCTVFGQFLFIVSVAYRGGGGVNYYPLIPLIGSNNSPASAKYFFVTHFFNIMLQHSQKFENNRITSKFVYPPPGEILVYAPLVSILDVGLVHFFYQRAGPTPGILFIY